MAAEIPCRMRRNRSCCSSWAIRPRRDKEPRTSRAQANGDHREVEGHGKRDGRAREKEPDRDGERDGAVRHERDRRQDRSSHCLVDRDHHCPQRFGRVALEPHQLRSSGVTHEQPRDEIDLCGVRRTDRQPQTEDREQAPRNEERGGDREQDQRSAVPIGGRDVEHVEHGPGKAARSLVRQQVDQRIDQEQARTCPDRRSARRRARQAGAVCARGGPTRAHPRRTLLNAPTWVAGSLTDPST